MKMSERNEIVTCYSYLCKCRVPGMKIELPQISRRWPCRKAEVGA